MSHLQLREIQAPIAACLIRRFAQECGMERALRTASEAIAADAEAAGKAMAERLGDDSLVAFARLVREVWSVGNAMSVRFLEETAVRLSFDVTRCAYVDLYERIGVRDLGFCLSCSRDEPFARGFNPRIRFVRTQTIMEGGSFCDFRFSLERS